MNFISDTIPCNRGGSYRGGVDHVGVGWGMLCRGGVGHVGMRWGESCRGGVGCIVVGWVMKGG